MNWYKISQIEQTLPYFQEFENDGEYVPNFQDINEKLKSKFNATMMKDLGQGDSGIAYMLSNGDVLKITTNAQEGKMANWLLSNPNPNIAEYRAVWTEGDLTCIIMEYIPEYVIDEPGIYKHIELMENLMSEYNCTNVHCAIKILKTDYRTKNSPYLSQIEDYLQHLSNSPFSPFDFLNPNNIGIKNNKLVFFDIT